MTVKTIRLNSKEESLVKRIQDFYRMDFSSCMKQLLIEKVEDMADTASIHRTKEGRKSDYVSAAIIDALFG